MLICTQLFLLSGSIALEPSNTDLHSVILCSSHFSGILEREKTGISSSYESGWRGCSVNMIDRKFVKRRLATNCSSIHFPLPLITVLCMLYW